jgi:hypothetical protein
VDPLSAFACLPDGHQEFRMRSARVSMTQPRKKESPELAGRPVSARCRDTSHCCQAGTRDLRATQDPDTPGYCRRALEMLPGRSSDCVCPTHCGHTLGRLSDTGFHDIVYAGYRRRARRVPECRARDAGWRFDFLKSGPASFVGADIAGSGRSRDSPAEQQVLLARLAV